VEKNRNKARSNDNGEYNSLLPEMAIDSNCYGNHIENSDVKQMSNYIPYTEYEDFNATMFLNDFLYNKGDRLISIDNQTIQTQLPEENKYSSEMNILDDSYINPSETDINQSLENDYTPPLNEYSNNPNTVQLSTENFSISLNGLKNNQNGSYQAQIQGNIFCKPLKGTIHLFYDQNQGTFKGSFSGNVN